MTIGTIAVGTDGSATASEAVRTATEMARCYGAKIVLLSAFQDPGWAPREHGESDDMELQWALSPSARVREVLARTEQDLRSEGLDCSTLVDQGDPGDVLVRLAEECGADVLVIGNKGMRRRLLGSVPNTVTHKARCSVFVVKTT